MCNKEASGPVLTYEDVAHGPHERNVLDFWQASSPTPTPVVVFIHGGGFKSGDKQSIRSTSGMRDIGIYQEHGVSFAAINYRFRETTTLDHIVHDCARAIQFLRFQASEWNIDPNRIAAYGGSAGGGASLWLGVHDDLADPSHQDPILRHSSKLSAVGHLNSQATYNPKPNIDPLTANEVIHHPRHAMYLQDMCELLGIPCVQYWPTPHRKTKYGSPTSS